MGVTFSPVVRGVTSLKFNMKGSLILLLTLSFGSFGSRIPRASEVEQKALDFVKSAEKQLEEATIKATELEWAYATNITDENEAKKTKFQVDQQKIIDF